MWCLAQCERIYLPDLGRFRLDDARLRRLRLVVFVPSEKSEKSTETVPALSGQSDAVSWPPKRDRSVPVHIAADLITDLEKLRLDALCVVTALADGQVGTVGFAHLEAVSPETVVAHGTLERVPTDRDSLRPEHC